MSQKGGLSARGRVGVYQHVLPSIMGQLMRSKRYCPFKGRSQKARFLDAFKQYRVWAKANTIVAQVKNKFKPAAWKGKVAR